MHEHYSMGYKPHMLSIPPYMECRSPDITGTPSLCCPSPTPLVLVWQHTRPTYEHSPQAMVDSIDREEVASFYKLLRERLLDTSKPFSKEYLQLLVKEIVLDGDNVRIKGRYASLAGAIKFTAQKKKLSTPG